MGRRVYSLDTQEKRNVGKNQYHSFKKIPVCARSLLEVQIHKWVVTPPINSPDPAVPVGKGLGLHYGSAVNAHKISFLFPVT